MTDFWDGYRGAVPEALLPDFRYVLGHVGCLMVARVDGKSPAEYLSPAEREAARAVGSRLLLAPPDSLGTALDSHRGHVGVTPTITGVFAREILDSGGRPTVEVDLELSDGSFARASVPAGTSTGRYEARELRDGDADRFAGEGVLGAVRHVRETIGGALVGRDPFDQAEIDAFLIALDGTADKSALGANAVLGVSIAVARAAATSKGIPLWQQLGGGSVLPLPMVNIISGGLHGDTRLAFQDFLVVPVGAETFREALECASAVRTATGALLRERGLSTLKAAEGGFAPPLPSPEAALDLLVEAVGRSGRSLNDEVAFAVDVAATHFFDGTVYRLEDTPDGIDADG